MKILLLSHIRGNLGLIEDLVRRTGAEAVIHAGEFGFYDRESPGRLAPRVLRRLLHRVETGPGDDVKAAMPVDELAGAALELGLLGDFPDYAAGVRRLPVPLYAVGSENDDPEVIADLSEGRSQVPNLNLLDGEHAAMLGGTEIFGLGGKAAAARSLFSLRPDGRDEAFWDGLIQMVQLIELADAADRATRRASRGRRILVTLARPGRDPVVGRLAARLGARFTISGHEVVPDGTIWNVRELEQREAVAGILRPRLALARQRWDRAREELDLGPSERQVVGRGLAMLAKMIPDGSSAREALDYAWLRPCFHLELPAAGFGYSLLQEGEDGATLVTRGDLARAGHWICDEYEGTGSRRWRRLVKRGPGPFVGVLLARVAVSADMWSTWFAGRWFDVAVHMSDGGELAASIAYHCEPRWQGEDDVPRVDVLRCGSVKQLEACLRSYDFRRHIRVDPVPQWHACFIDATESYLRRFAAAWHEAIDSLLAEIGTKVQELQRPADR